MLIQSNSRLLRSAGAEIEAPIVEGEGRIIARSSAGKFVDEQRPQAGIRNTFQVAAENHAGQKLTVVLCIGEHNRRGEEGEDRDGRRGRPRPRPAAPGRHQQEPRGRERDHQRRGELRRRVRKRRELAREDHDREADGEEERSRQPLARGQLDQPSAAEREPREQERERKPGDEQGGQRTQCTGATRPELIRLRARFGEGS